jgi:hypothetical protein
MIHRIKCAHITDLNTTKLLPPPPVLLHGQLASTKSSIDQPPLFLHVGLRTTLSHPKLMSITLYQDYVASPCLRGDKPCQSLPRGASKIGAAQSMVYSLRLCPWHDAFGPQKTKPKNRSIFPIKAPVFYNISLPNKDFTIPPKLSLYFLFSHGRTFE